MKFLLTCFSAVLALQFVSSLVLLDQLQAPTSECKTSDECSAGILDISAINIGSYTTGKCLPYVRENDDCYMSGFGSCGCEPETTCVKVAELGAVISPQQKQEKMLIMRPPGVYRCVRK